MLKNTIIKRALLLCAMLLPAFAASWAYNFEVDGIYYNKSGSEATVTYASSSYNSYSGDVTIPETVEYEETTYTVTAIYQHAFQACTELTSVTIPATVTSIGINAFYKCTALETVTILGSGLESIGNMAFYDCTALETVNIPESVTSIGNSAFYDCSSLESITIPDGVASIGNYAFQNCTSLSSVSLGSGIESIGTYAFDGCSALESIEIPDGCLSIGNYAFRNCASLSDIDLGSGVQTIGTYVFSGCTSLESITIPDSVTSLGDYSFKDCTSLTDVTIGDGVTEITKNIFSGCSALTTLSIGNGVTAIDDNAFQNFTSLTTVTFGSSLETIGARAFYGCTALTSVTFPESLVSIGDYAFDGCTSLTEVVIPDNVTYIGTQAFYGCTSLESVVIGSGVETISSNAFGSCTALTDLTIGENVSTIGDNAFFNCSSLTSVTLPESVVSVGAMAFAECSSLSEIVSLNPTPPDISESAFFGVDEDCDLVVPEGSEEAYAEADVWSDFLSISDGVSTLEASDITSTSATLNGKILSDVVTATAQGFEYGTSEELSDATQVSVEEMDAEGNISYSLTDLTERTTYYFRTYAETDDGTMYGTIHSFLTIDPPTVSTLDVEEYGADYAYFNGQITVSSQEDIVEYGFRYIDTYDVVDYSHPFAIDNIAEDGSMTLELDGLQPETTYYVWAYAVTANGTFIGEEKSFTTPAAEYPEVTTSEEVSDITSSSGTVSGQISVGNLWANQEISESGFQYALTDDFTGAPTISAEADAEGIVTTTLVELNASTEYVFRAYAVIGGEYYYGDPAQAFTTLAVAEVTTSEDVSDITVSSATVSGQVITEQAITKAWFEYGLTEEWENADSIEAEIGEEGYITATITGLEASTEYVFRACALVGEETYYGDGESFTTSDAVIISSILVEDESTTATLKGQVSDGVEATAMGFVYGESEDVDEASEVTDIYVNNDNTGTIGTLSDLTIGTTYYVWAYAMIDGNKVYSDMSSFVAGDSTTTGTVALGSDQSSPEEIARYDLMGRKLSKPQKGVNIVVYSDGTAKKIAVKE